MSSQQDNQRVEKDRCLVRQWMSDPSAEPLVIQYGRSYKPRDVLWPGWASIIRQNLRSLLVLIAGVIPLSSCKVVIYRLLGMKIGKGVFISPHVMIDPLYPELITLQDECVLGVGCRLFTHEVTATNFRLGRITVGADSVVGAYSTIRSGVTIGEGATVGFDSFVNRDVPRGATVVGIPARVLDGREGAD